MAQDTSKIEMTICMRSGHTSSTEKIDDQAFLRHLIELADGFNKSEGQTLMYVLGAYLKSREGRRVLGIIEGRKDIEENGGHDFDEVIKELEAIVHGDDDGDDSG